MGGVIMPLLGPPAPAHPPFLFLRPMQIALGALLGWTLHSRRTARSKTTE
jgi:hypothetical protein